FEACVISIHEILGVGRGVQLPGVTSPWGLGGGIHAASGEDTAPDSWLVALLKNEISASHRLLAVLLKALRTDHRD
ncbi:hypothetical protein, partial [Xanthomonas nasturtii]|uniref:hypothetical protein n=1 Tax=Xanthomonas nasturtii TaxID=1843581 RepID=UPI002010E531